MSRFPRTSFRTAAVQTPSDVGSILRHWDASVTSSITKDGSNRVSLWNDLSGNGGHLEAPAGDNEPLYDDDAVNSMAGIIFQGTEESENEYMRDNTLTAFDDSWEMFMVCREDANTSGSFSTIASVLNNFLLRSDGVGVVQRIYLSDLSILATPSGAVPTEGNPYLLNTYWDAANDTLFCAANGEIDTATDTDVINSPTEAFWLNRWFANYGDYTHCEIIFFDKVLSADERTGIRNYLMLKWGVSL